MRTREERMAAFLQMSQKEITLEEATAIITEEGLDSYKRKRVTYERLSPRF